MSIFAQILIVGWGFLMIGAMAIGGFFMFRKFLKQLPKEDGKSIMDWQDHYIAKTKNMWEAPEKELLEELIAPVPELFRDVARQTIAGKIGEVALRKNASKITREILIEGYIVATPKRDHKILKRTLKKKDIDITPYQPYFEASKADYSQNWKAKYTKAKSRQ
ncbi:DUF2621 family protein [Virgibacillus sp. 179-BFC.A HS]|uniref:DUF2621 family protein n=1 Tax=Tigheibacillus jepli TaxID=3035914 RepID=A0ABU5CHI2_9BACI|nr:DUF2621 family protein [Virgibacillus sp. 179-BFC.A HS]MDY0405789.1 DUF2621 family protein [Virgibacillus sp. 179-BFC.A HS]